MKYWLSVCAGTLMRCAVLAPASRASRMSLYRNFVFDPSPI